MLWHAAVFPRIVRRLAPDVVHLPNVIFSPLRPTPVVMTVHDLAHFRFPEKFGRLRARLLRPLIWAAVRLPQRLVAVSEFTRADLARFVGMPPHRTTVIPEGAPEAEATVAHAAATPYLLYVGQIERSKNVEALVEAFLRSDVLAAGGVELYLVGTPGNATPAVERIVSANRERSRRIRTLGYVAVDRLPGLYANALAFVFPSLVEGFGLVLLEAMAYGAPVIAMRTAAIPEVVGDAALLLEPGHGEAMQQALESIYTDEGLRDRLRRLGRQRVAEFTWERTARKTFAAFEELTRCRANSPPAS